MEYIVTFIEGLMSFISPCTLPLLPVYIAYFGAESSERRRTVSRVLLFIAGFTIVFTAMGVLAGTLGSFLVKWRRPLTLVCGIIVILFGLAALGVFNIGFSGPNKDYKMGGSLLSAFVFGLVYAVNMTPCIGTFLGSALMLAASSATAAKGTVLLIVYSLGLGIPFLLTALLMDRLKNLILAIKDHYNVITKIMGVFLIAAGVLMAAGAFPLFGSARNGSSGGNSGSSESAAIPDESSEAVSESETVTETEAYGPKLDPALDFYVEDADGNTVHLFDFSGKPVVFNFWATWCPYCVKEMDGFEEAYLLYGDEVQFMMIDVCDGVQETKSKALDYVEEQGYTFPVFFDTSGSAIASYGVTGLPMTVFVNADGDIYSMFYGAMQKDKVMEQLEIISGAGQ
ncbi:MAG: redoxin domain-containing protein [Lachnospiraceae bacterium]|nr:redoxin domain-containing protein [Lachnospiraceae bacterium]